MRVNFSDLPSTSLAGGLLRKLLAAVPKGAVVPIMQGPLRGKRWILGSSPHGCWLGSYELSKQLTFERIVSAGSVVYDIGANVGFYTLLATALVGPTGMVYAFEPFPRNYEFLNRHLALNKIRNATVITVAVSSRDGECLFEPGELHSTGRLSNSGSLHVKAVKLDTLIQNGQLKPPHVMKIDVEGAELDVLRGCEATLEECRPAILLATHNKTVHESCCEVLRLHGYRLNSLTNKDIAETDELIAMHHTKWVQ